MRLNAAINGKISTDSLLQAFADATKLLLKEYVAPTQANIALFFLGPVITLIFGLLGYAALPYGPGLLINDMDLGIFYLLAVSSLATYGILMAGLKNFSTFLHTKNTQYEQPGRSYSTPWIFTSLHLKYVSGQGYVSNISKPRFIVTKIPENYNTYLSQYFNISSSKRTFEVPKRSSSLRSPSLIGITLMRDGVGICFIHTSQDKIDSNNNNKDKDEYIQDLFKDRIAPVIPFNRNLIKGSCLNYTDRISKAKFLKEWGSKVGIYLIEYKYYPNIYYIGRTNLLKKRLFEHSKAESNSKFHLFIRLIGIEHFNIHILEVCPETKLGERETYYLQKYIPILNSVFSSSITEGVIKQTLLLKLKDLRAINRGKDSRVILVYAYEWTEKGINPQPTIYNSTNEASRSLAYPISGLLRYKNTSIPYRGKLFFNYPITDFNQVFEQSKKLTPKGLLNRVISTQVWAYDAINLELIKGSPFVSKNKAAKALNIPRATIDLVLDKGRTAGSKAIYVYSKPLSVKEIKPLIAKAGYLQLGLKLPVYVYDATRQGW